MNKQSWSGLGRVTTNAMIREGEGGQRAIQFRIVIDEFDGGRRVEQAFDVSYRLANGTSEKAVAYLLRACVQDASVWITGRVRTQSDYEGYIQSVWIRALDVQVLTPPKRGGQPDQDEEQPRSRSRQDQQPTSTPFDAGQPVQPSPFAPQGDGCRGVEPPAPKSFHQPSSPPSVKEVFDNPALW
jgi:hypothetical protein